MKKKAFLFYFFVLFIGNSFAQQNWSFIQVPKFRQLHDIHVLSLQHYAVVGGHPFNDSIRFMSHTLDGGNNWYFVDVYLGKMLKSFIFFNAQDGLASGFNSVLYRTGNGGQSWQSESFNLPLQHLTTNAMYSKTGPDVWAAGGLNGNDGFLVKSADFGLTWGWLNTWNNNELYDVAVNDAGHIYISGNNNFFKFSADSGATWTDVLLNGLDSIVDLKGLSFYGDFGVCVGGRSGNDSLTAILFTSNQGQSWQTAKLIQGVCLNDVAVVNDTIAYAVGDNGTVYKTINGGINWVNESLPGNYDFDLFAVHFKNLHLGGISGRWGAVFIYNDGYLQAPQVLTDDATMVTVNSARLNATANAGNQPSKISFLYGTQTPPDQEVFVDSLFDNITYNKYIDISSLNVNTDYFFQAKLDNATGAYYGGIKFFKTNHIANIGAATNITTSSAQLNGYVSAQEATGVYFAYAPHFQPFTEVYIDTLINANYLPVTLSLTQLQPDTYYDFYIKAENSQGVFYSDTNFFKTLAPQNEAFTLSATQVTRNSAMLHGAISVLSEPTAAHFVYGTLNPPDTEVFIDTFFNVQGAPLQYMLANLLEDTKYFYRVKLSNDFEDVAGDVKTFFTGNPIPNWDFEHWTTTEINAPKYWNIGGNVQIGMCSANDYAVGLYTGHTLDGISMLINFNASDGENFTGGFPTSYRPNSMYVTLRYDVEHGDSAMVFVALKKQGTYVSENWFFITGTSHGQFVEKTFDLVYLNNEIPDSIQVGFTNSNPFNEDVFFNSSLEVCKLHFDETALILPNMNFSETVKYDYEYPDSWGASYFYDIDNQTIVMPFSKSTDAFFNDYAICLQAVFNAYDTLSYLSAVEKENDYFPINEKHEFLQVYVKYAPELNDTARISVTIFDNGQHIGQGGIDIFEHINTWQELIIPIFYWDTLATPNGANIHIQSTSWENPKNSVLCVDKLSFDGDFVPIVKPHELKPDIVVYPNPFKDVLHIDFNGLYGQEFLIEMFDLNGKRIYAEIITEIQHSISTGFLGNGLYLLRISSGKDLVLKKVIKI